MSHLISGTFGSAESSALPAPLREPFCLKTTKKNPGASLHPGFRQIIELRRSGLFGGDHRRSADHHAFATGRGGFAGRAEDLGAFGA